MVDMAISSTEIEVGVPPAIVARRSSIPVSRLAAIPAQTMKMPAWTEKEDDFLKTLGSWKKPRSLGLSAGQ
jgi:hypothetical protein